MRKTILLTVALAALSACRGAIPGRNAPPEQAISAILIGSRFLLPSGQTYNGLMHINFESEGGRQAEVYRLPITGGENFLYLVEPGVYRIAPTRSVFGFYQEMMNVVIDGRQYRLPFPRDLLRQPPYTIKASKIVAMGILEARVLPALPGRQPQLRIRLDDGVSARRKVVQDTIRDMMDPNLSPETRESTIAWSRALQDSLMNILSEEQKRTTYKPAP
ncbi:MAG: hypothetical protein AAB262_13565 [Elusimicrobiota bacterium]